MNFYLSFSDLILLEGFGEAYGSYNKKKINDYLWNSGMDVKQDVEESYVNHRNLRNQAITCIRYCGYERTDREWIRTGAASLNAIILSTKDMSLRRELKEMSKEVLIDQATNGAFHEHLGE